MVIKKMKQNMVRKYVENQNVSTETAMLLSKLDLFTVQLAFKIPKQIVAQSIHKKDKFRSKDGDDIETRDVDLAWRKNGEGFHDWERDVGSVTVIDRVISENFTCTTLDEDDFYVKDDKGGTGSFLKTLIMKLYKKINPLRDCIVEAPSDEISAQFLKDLNLDEGNAMPESYTVDFDMQSDESFSRMFFYGIGAPLLAAQESVSDYYRRKFGPFLVDMPIHNLKVRKGFRPYGARVFFDYDRRVTAIFDYAKKEYFYPHSEYGWEEAKCLAKVTAMVIATAQEHLVNTHLIVANSATVASTMELPPSHPIRRLLTIFTFRSTEVNTGAFKILVPKEMLLHRATALEYESITELFDSAYVNSIAFQPFSRREYIPELIDLSNNNEFPYIDQGEEYYEIVRSFVSEWLTMAGDMAYDDCALNFYNSVRESTAGQAYQVPEYRSMSDLIDVIAQIIFTVTAYHELVGTVVDYSRLPDRAGFRLCDNQKKTDIQSFLIQALITSTTNIPMPLLMNPFEKFFGVGGAPEWECVIWGKFLNRLEGQSKRVHRADVSRDVEFKTFDPLNFECSVSV